MTAAERPATRLWREALAKVDALLDRPPAERDLELAQLASSRPQLHSIVASAVYSVEIF